MSSTKIPPDPLSPGLTTSSTAQAEISKLNDLDSLREAGAAPNY